MSLSQHWATKKQPIRPQKKRPLQNGDRLTLREFKELYAHHTEIRRAELVEGVVYVASPVYRPHALALTNIMGWLYQYVLLNSDVELSGEQSLEIDGDNELQPGAMLWRLGSVEINESGLMSGSPDLVIEVAASSASYDLGVKKQVYRRNRVSEYLVLAVYEQEVYWFSLEEGKYVQLNANNGLYCSTVFKGLCLDQLAFWNNDKQALIKALGGA